MSTESPTPAEPTAQPMPAELLVPPELRTALEQARYFADGLRAVCERAKATQEQLAAQVDKAEKAQATAPSLGATALNAAVWAGASVLAAWSMARVLRALDSRAGPRRERGTTEADTEPPAQPGGGAP